MELRLRRSPGWPVLLNMMKQKLLGNQLVAGHSSTDALYCKSQLSIKCQMNCLGRLLLGHGPRALKAKITLKSLKYYPPVTTLSLVREAASVLRSCHFFLVIILSPIL